MKPVRTDHARVLRDLFPIDDGHVLVLSTELHDDVIDLRPVRPEFGHGEEQRRARREPKEDLVEFSLVRNRIAPIVAPEEDHSRVPHVITWLGTRVEHLIEHLVPEFHEPTRFGLDLRFPTKWHQFLAQVAPIPRRRSGEDRVTNEQYAIPLGRLTDQVSGRTIFVDGARDPDYRLSISRNRVRKHAHSTDCRHGCCRRKAARVGSFSVHQPARTRGKCERGDRNK